MTLRFLNPTRADVTFWLITPERQVLTNREAQVTVNNLLLMGGR